MRKSELNEIIRKKILEELDETDQMKAFLLEVLDAEIKNIHEGVQSRYKSDYMESVQKLSKEEQR